MPKQKDYQIPKITQLPSGAYRCRLRYEQPDGTKKDISITGASRAVVEAKARALKAGLAEAPRGNGNMTLKDAMIKYMAERSDVLSPSTIRGYDQIARCRFKGYINKPLSAFTSATCQRMVNDEAKRYAPKTVYNSWGFASAAIEAETGRRVKVTLPQQTSKEREFLDPDEIKVFLGEIQGKPYEIAALLALHSLRASEIVAVTLGDIDFKHKTLTVRGAFVRDKNNKLVEKKSNKNRSSKRTIPIMIPRLLELLTVVPENGPLVKPNNMYRNFNRVCKRAGLPLVGVHGLRHSFASLCASPEMGIPEAQCLKWGGWANPETMRKIYRHVSDRQGDAYAAKMERFFSVSAPDKGHEKDHDDEDL